MADQSRAHSLMDVSWIELSIAAVFVLLRFWTTFFYLPEKPNGFARAATYCAALAWCIGLVNAVCIQMAVNNGMGLHITEVPPSTLPAALAHSWAANAMSRLSIAAGKVAVVLFIVGIQHRALVPWQRILLSFVAITNICINIAVVFMVFLQCSPPRKLWNMSVPGTCDLKKANGDYGFFTAAWGAASDATLAIYPIHLVWSLQMEQKMKVVLSILFSLGMLASACACVTCYQLHVVTNTTDPTWVLVPLIQWSYTEMWVVIIAACIPPTLPRVWKILAHARTVLSARNTADGSKRKDSLQADFTDHGLLRCASLPDRTQRDIEMAVDVKGARAEDMSYDDVGSRSEASSV